LQARQLPRLLNPARPWSGRLASLALLSKSRAADVFELLLASSDLLDRLALDEVFTPYPGNRLHDQHPRPPTSLQSRQRNRPIYRGSILALTQFW
jgi:hypothetical protein